MTKNEIKLLIKQLDREHSYDRDGGYGLVAEILKLRNHLDGTDQKKLRELLLELVAKQDRTLWGVALEVLLQEGSPETLIELESLIRSGKRIWEWKNQIILGLLRVGYDKALDIYLAHIQSGIYHNRPVGMLLAHLYNIDPDLSIKMSSQFFGKHLSSEDGASIVKGYIPAFVQNLTRKDEEPLLRLTAQTALISQQSGEKLRNLLLDYLSKPWVAREQGKEKVNRLRRVLSQSV